MIMSDAIVTFSQQSESWLESLKTRKRKPVSPATLRVFGSYMRRLTPMIGEKNLADISNGVLRDLVQRLDAQKLSAKMISELIAVVKQVVASAVDAPTIIKQRQPSITTKHLEQAIKNARTDQERALYCLLAGTGLRISECLAIRVNGTDKQTSRHPTQATISVQASIYSGKELRAETTLACFDGAVLSESSDIPGVKVVVV